LPDAQADELVKELTSRANQLAEVEGNIDSLLVEARAERERTAKGKKAKQKVGGALPPASEPPPTVPEETAHTRAQSMLVELGRTTGCSVWIASNDRSKTYKGKKLADDCLKALPNLGLNPEVMEKIGRIDVLWLQQNAPICAFEVESTTQVFSGLLRMADLLALVPALKMKLYIVAAKEREGKVMDELDRPTFRKIGLSDYCEFISFDALASLLDKVAGFRGHVQFSILDKIAVGLPDDAAI
jgi:hypothetical protein